VLAQQRAVNSLDEARAIFRDASSRRLPPSLIRGQAGNDKAGETGHAVKLTDPNKGFSKLSP
jgi:hypothetical protein